MSKFERPIFIVGCPSSGTTLLRLILDSHPHISSGPESKFLPDMAKIVGQYKQNLDRYRFVENYWHDKIRDFFESFQIEYAKKRGKIRWAEKTPKNTLHLDFINTLFPDCQVIHIIRDGYDVISSYKKRWGFLRAAVGAVWDWEHYVTTAQDFGSKLSQDRYCELRYEDLVHDTEKTLIELFAFLKEPWEPCVLLYEDYPHDMPDDRDTKMMEKRKNYNDARMIFSGHVGSGKKKLNIFLKILLLMKSRKLLRELGY